MAGCKQILSNRDFANIGDVTIYRPVLAGQVGVSTGWATTAAGATQKILAAGNLTNLNATLNAVPGGAATRTFTLYKNGIATAMAFVIGPAGLTGSNSAVVDVVAGDLVYVEMATAGTR
jgi:hypothetical protein